MGSSCSEPSISSSVSPCSESVSSLSLPIFSPSLWLCSSCSEPSISSSVSPCSESVSSYSTPIPLCLPAFLLIGGIDTVVGILIAPFCPAYIFVGGLKIVELIFKFDESLCLQTGYFNHV